MRDSKRKAGLGSLIQKCVEKLDSPSFKYKDLVPFVENTIATMTRMQISELLLSIRDLQIEEKYIMNIRSTQDLSKVIAALSYWIYVTTAYTMDMLFLSSIRKDFRTTVEEISGYESGLIIRMTDKFETDTSELIESMN